MKTPSTLLGRLLFLLLVFATAALIHASHHTVESAPQAGTPVFASAVNIQPYTVIQPGDVAQSQITLQGAVTEGYPCVSGVKVWDVNASAPDTTGKLIISCRLVANAALVTFRNDGDHPVAAYGYNRIVWQTQ